MRPVAAIVCAALAVALGGSAAAHAFLDHADPKVGSTVSEAPSEVRLWFTQGLELRFCTVTVVGPAGFGGGGPVEEMAGASGAIAVPLRRPLPPGVYNVRWRVLSVDSHVTQGDFTFKVRP